MNNSGRSTIDMVEENRNAESALEKRAVDLDISCGSYSTSRNRQMIFLGLFLACFIPKIKENNCKGMLSRTDMFRWGKHWGGREREIELCPQAERRRQGQLSFSLLSDSDVFFLSLFLSLSHTHTQSARTKF